VRPAACGREMFHGLADVFRETKKKIGLTMTSVMLKAITAAVRHGRMCFLSSPVRTRCLRVCRALAPYAAIILLLRGITRDDFCVPQRKVL